MPERGGSCTPSRCFGVSAYTVAVDPQIPGGSGRPDPRVARGGKAMYVECVVLFDDGSRQSTDSEAWIKDFIDAIASNYRALRAKQ